MESVAGQDVRGILPEGLGAAVRDTAEEIAALLRGAPTWGVGCPGRSGPSGRRRRIWRRQAS
ncbi:hypothetical protein SAV14893_083810 [Streptomyces avermitilis]|uniref:Uncharacterized protein n=1 Tax=Streptomyces avermitilis TaxID=33903 RepID=A0A4D4MAT5_STRAX|nr:hypothetical protein SAV14893_083810 [Streptomyces avermitilis]